MSVLQFEYNGVIVAQITHVVVVLFIPIVASNVTHVVFYEILALKGNDPYSSLRYAAVTLFDKSHATSYFCYSFFRYSRAP